MTAKRSGKNAPGRIKPISDLKSADEKPQSAELTLSPLDHLVGSNKATQTNSEEGAAKSLFWTRVMAVSNLAAVVAAVIYAWINFGQWQDMRRNARTDERAWVGIVYTEVRTEHLPGSDMLVFKVPYTNTGKTPALNVHSWIGQTNNMSSVMDHVPSTDVPHKATLFPAGVMNTSTADHPISPSAADSIRLGMNWYVHGQIWYDDIFGAAHWTRFCLIPRGEELKAFTPCPDYNGTDDVSR